MLMTARMRFAGGVRPGSWLGVLVLLTVTGCHSIHRKHEAKHIPQYGVIDPNQPRELLKAPMPLYVIEPPDELEIAIKPPMEDPAPSTVVVQPDGFIDLGFVGSVYVVGLTLADAEERIAEHLNALPKKNGEP